MHAVKNYVFYVLILPYDLTSHMENKVGGGYSVTLIFDQSYNDWTLKKCTFLGIQQHLATLMCLHIYFVKHIKQKYCYAIENFVLI